MTQSTITVQTTPKDIINITKEVAEVVASSNAQLCNLFVQHTSCSLIISENADPDVLTDLKDFMAKLVPEGNQYRHGAEGLDDMPAHIRNVLTQTSLSIPIIGNKLQLGTWQGIYLWEHRALPHSRNILITTV